MPTYNHIHIVGSKIGASLEGRLSSLGFFNDDFLQVEEGFVTTVTHRSREVVNGSAAARAVFQQVVGVLQDAPEFNGYVQSEVFSEKLRREYTFREYSPLADFPIGQLTFAEPDSGKHKACDIHIERPLHIKRDSLDRLFLNNGFYETQTSRHRIYTIQFESIVDGKNAFKVLDRYFERVGGVTEMTFEPTVNYWTKPADFPVPRMVRSITAK